MVIRSLGLLGRGARRLLALAGGLARFYGRFLWNSLRARRLPKRLLGKIALNQFRFTGLQAMPLIAAVAALIGAVTIIQSVQVLTGLRDDLIGTLLVSIIVRELGPLITAVILIGRSGTAMATELGAMRLNGEIEALQAHRIDPVDYVVLPRVHGAVVSMLALIVVFDLMGILGGLGIAVMVQDVSFALLEHRVMESLTNLDVLISVLKAVLFGQAIAVLSCFSGLGVRKSPTELPQAVTKAVVLSLGAVFLIDSLLAAAFYL